MYHNFYKYLLSSLKNNNFDLHFFNFQILSITDVRYLECLIFDIYENILYTLIFSHIRMAGEVGVHRRRGPLLLGSSSTVVGRGGGDNGSATSTAEGSSLRQGGIERCSQSRHQGTSAS